MKNTASLQEVPVTGEPRDRQHTAANAACVKAATLQSLYDKQHNAVAFRVYTDTRPLHAHQVVIVHVKLINYYYYYYYYYCIL